MANVERVAITRLRVDTAKEKRKVVPPGTIVTFTEEQAAALDRIRPPVVYDPRVRARNQARQEQQAAERISQVAEPEIDPVTGERVQPAASGARVDASAAPKGQSQPAGGDPRSPTGVAPAAAPGAKPADNGNTSRGKPPVENDDL